MTMEKRRTNNRRSQEVPDEERYIRLTAEQSVLGAALIRPEAAVWVMAHMRRSEFYSPTHKKIFDALCWCLERDLDFDLTTAEEALRNQEALESIGGPPYLADLAACVPTASNVHYYAKLVQEAASARELLALRDEIPTLLATSDDPVATWTQIISRGEAIFDRAVGNAKRVFNAVDLLQEEMPEPEFIIPGVLPQGLTFLFGQAKQGKSWLAYQLAIAVATGGRALGMIPVRQGRALYLALEDNKRRLKKRLEKLLGENAERPANLDLAIEWRKINDGGVAELDAYCRKHPDTRLIIIDVFGKVRPTREKSSGIYMEDYQDLSALKSVADRHNCAILLIHHQNKTKDPQDVTHTFSGSTGLAGAVDGWMVLQRERGRPYATLQVEGRDLEEPLSLAVEWDPRTIWTLCGEAAQYIHSREQREVIELLMADNRSITVKELALNLDIKQDTARKRLERMVPDILASDKGSYRLSAAFLADHARTSGFVSNVSDVSAVRNEPSGHLDSLDREDREDINRLFPQIADPPPAPTLSFPDGPLPDPLTWDEDEPDAAERQSVFDLAYAKRWPRYQHATGQVVDGSEHGWRPACSHWPAGWLPLWRAFLEALP